VCVLMASIMVGAPLFGVVINVYDNKPAVFAFLSIFDLFHEFVIR